MGTVLIGFQALTLAVALAQAPQQGTANATPPPAAPAQEDARPVELPVSLERIQQALSRPPAIKTRTDRPVFRVEVFARQPTVADILGPDYLNGPVPAAGSMSHREFLDMVTPVEYRGMSMFSNREVMTIAATSIGLQWAVMKAVDKLKEAKSERAKEAARQEVLQAMNELEAARKKAGLPPR